MSTDEQTRHSIGQPNPHYPRHASDRADALLGMLDEAQQLRLYQALKQRTYAQWLDWVDEKKRSICEFDSLSERALMSQIRASVDEERLFLLYACLWLELARVRLTKTYHLPPRGAPLVDDVDHRAAMLHIHSAFEPKREEDLWPFDVPDGQSGFPFASES